MRRHLLGRGLTVAPAVLQGHQSLPYHGEDGRLVGTYPAMVAPVVGPDGRLQSAHRTYLADLTPRKKAMSPVETIRGAAVRLFDPADATLGVSEGIETGIAAHELFGIATWAALSTAGMETFEPPDGLRGLVILADNDANYAGQRAAYALAARAAKTVPEVKVMVPPEPGTDWLDVLNQRQTSARAAS